MKVYFLDAAGCRQRRPDQYRLILRTLRKLGSSLLVEKSRSKQTEPLFPEIVYQAGAELIGEADLIIAEITEPGFKTGFLLATALKRGKLVLGLVYGEKKSGFELPPEETDLFLEHYDEENIGTVLRRFLAYVTRRKKAKGKLIVIDGTDGSGKATQSQLLLRYLKDKGLKTKFVDFPRYYTSFHGGTVGRYLAGEFGGVEKTNPYLVSLIYALDRLAAKEEIEDWLDQGNIVVANRYTSSNMAHQTSKLPPGERKQFLAWLYEMEYKVHKLPREEIVLFLHLPAEIGQGLVDRKGKRAYISGRKRDIHEANLVHLKEAEKMYLYLARTREYWARIRCLDKKENLRSPEEIHREVVKLLEERKIIVGNRS